MIIADVLDEAGAATEKDLQAAGYDATFVHLDVADEASWREAYALLDSRHGRLDILVNNAGIIHETAIADEDLSTWSRLLAVNLTGVFLGLRTMVPLLRKGTNAAVVNTSSVYGPAGPSATPPTAPANQELSVLPAPLRSNGLMRGSASTPCCPAASSPP